MLQRILAPSTTLRTLAYQAYPAVPRAIHGRVSGIVVSGPVSVVLSQTSAFSANVELVARSNSYRSAPATGFHANAGVRLKVCGLGCASLAPSANPQVGRSRGGGGWHDDERRYDRSKGTQNHGLRFLRQPRVARRPLDG